jgi:hypothetical protein
MSDWLETVSFGQIQHMARNRHLIILVFSAIVLLVMGVSCKDKKPSGTSCTDPIFCQSVLVAKDFFFFKQGSWWVYEEATSHERDSMYVIQSVNSTTNYNFDITIKSALTDYEYHYWPEYYGYNNGCSMNGPVSKKCLYVNRSKYKFQNLYAESFVFFIRYNKDDFIYTGADVMNCPNNTITIAEIYDSLAVAGASFQHVVRVDELCCFHEGNQPTKFYYTKNVGIIRKDLIDSNQVWNLVNYHIEP